MECHADFWNIKAGDENILQCDWGGPKSDNKIKALSEHWGLVSLQRSTIGVAALQSKEKKVKITEFK